MNDRLYGTIETQITENNEISTVLYGNNQQIATYTSEVPQIQTIIQAGYLPAVSVINAPFIEVTSVNGMTGDVITEPIIKGFEPNHYYIKDTVISKSGKLYSANETFTSGQYFDANDWSEISGGGETRPAYDKIQKIKNYLFETWYSNLDYTNAIEYFQTKKPTVGGACTSIRKGNFFARNYDWTYDENAEFIIRTSRANGYYATMGIGGSITGLTNAVVTSGEPNDLYKLVPFFLQDGINEFGLTVSTNVTPNQHGDNSYVNPTGTVREEICSIMLPRYILDHYQTASEAVTDIQQHLKVFTPKTLGQMGYDQQYLIADGNETYVLEFNEGGYVIVEHNFITNFYIADVNFNPDGSVWTPADVPTHLPTSNNLTTHAMGLERYNLVNSRYASLSTKQDFITLLSDLYYTKCYTTAPVVSNPFWFTECIYGDLTIDSPTSDFDHVVSVMAQRYTDRSRTDGGLTWQTVHSSLYDMEEKKLYLRVQEENGDTEYVFDFFYTAREVDDLLEGKVDKVSGKGLSTNDYTTTEKIKLGGIESGAQKNVQPDWNQSTDTSADYIKNKPTLGSLASKNSVSTTDITDSSITPAKLSTSYLPTSGGNMTGVITNSKQGSWWQGRRTTTVYNQVHDGQNAFNPSATSKSYNGTWSMGCLGNDTSDPLYLSYCPDTSYEAASNTGCVNLKITKDGIPAASLQWSTLLDKIYPVGSIYISVSHTTATAVKNALGGGTWVAWGAGRVPLGMGSNGTTNYTTVEATGGEEKHKLTVSEMPSHSHTSKTAIGWQTGGGNSVGRVTANDGDWNGWPTQINNTGGGGSHENRQPYITVYMWKRTA